MDGTIADLYANPNWLELLRNYDPTPYKTAKPLIRMQTLARMLNRLQANGYRIGIISWLSKTSNADYDEAVTEAKKNWLKKHLPSVKWDEINIVRYGMPKTNFINDPAILFDDEAPNREAWNDYDDCEAYDVTNIIEILKTL